jgi:hypothetical protein
VTVPPKKHQKILGVQKIKCCKTPAKTQKNISRWVKKISRWVKNIFSAKKIKILFFFKTSKN